MPTFNDMLAKVASADIDGDGDLEVLSVNPRSRQGSMGGDRPVAYGTLQFPDGPFHLDDFAFDFGARWLPYRGDLYLIYFADEQLEQATGVVAVTGTPGIACRFAADFEESFRATLKNPTAQSHDPAIRAAFDALRASKSSYTETIKADPLKDNDRRYLTGAGFTGKDAARKWETPDALRDFEYSISKTSSVRAADIDHDGVKERMVFVKMVRDRGRGCWGYFLELLPSAGQSTPDPVLRDTLRRMQGVDWAGYDPAPCGSNSEVVEVDGKGYLLENRLGPSNRKRRLYYVMRDGEWFDVMRSAFTPTHKVVFDRSKGGPVNQGDKK